MANIKMLLIDDKMLTTDLDRAGYKQMGISVKQSSNFGEADKHLSENGADILVINYDFEKIDALNICEHYKATNSDLTVVITSVQTAASVRKKAIKAGADLFIEQPLPRQMFVEKIKKLLDQVTRSTSRINIKEKAKLIAGEHTYEMPIQDISTSGILLQTKLDLPEGETVFLSFRLPDDAADIEVRGTIARKLTDHSSQTGLGVRFEEFKGKTFQKLEKYVHLNGDAEKEMVYYL